MTIGRRTRNFVFSIALALALPVSAHAATVFADGKEWRQVTDTVMTSWNTLAASCDTTSGVCGGAYSGWTWASGFEVSELFGDLIVADDGVTLLHPQIIMDEFTPTFDNRVNAVSLVGWVRNSPQPGYGGLAGLTIHSLPEWFYFFYGTEWEPVSTVAPYIGAWMYMTVAPVPEPEIYAMMGLGLGLMGWAGRRKRLKEAQSA
jgi:hypothetical protein